jgi:hypothetical protein
MLAATTQFKGHVYVYGLVNANRMWNRYPTEYRRSKFIQPLSRSSLRLQPKIVTFLLQYVEYNKKIFQTISYLAAIHK